MPSIHLDLERLPESGAKHSLVRLQGKLSLETVHNFIQTVKPDPAEHLILDLSGVTFLDSAGTGALVQLFVHRRNKGQTFALARLTTQSSAVLQVAGLTKLLPTYVSNEEALSARNS